jgi:hypothetical protein
LNLSFEFDIEMRESRIVFGTPGLLEMAVHRDVIGAKTGGRD